jgi:hypothetical protein
MISTGENRSSRTEILTSAQRRSWNLSESRGTDHEAPSRAAGQLAGQFGQPNVSLYFVLSSTHKKFYINVASLNELSILCPLLLHWEAVYHNTDKSPLKLFITLSITRQYIGYCYQRLHCWTSSTNWDLKFSYPCEAVQSGTNLLTLWKNGMPLWSRSSF